MENIEKCMTDKIGDTVKSANKTCNWSPRRRGERKWSRSTLNRINTKRSILRFHSKTAENQ